MDCSLLYVSSELTGKLTRKHAGCREPAGGPKSRPPKKNCIIEEYALIIEGSAVSPWSKIKALNIEKYLETIIVTDHLGPDYSKTNPDAIKRVQGSLPGSDIVCFADNPLKDFIAPAVFGWLPSIRVRRVGALYFDVPKPDDCIEAASSKDVDVLPSMQQQCGGNIRGALSS